MVLWLLDAYIAKRRISDGVTVDLVFALAATNICGLDDDRVCKTISAKPILFSSFGFGLMVQQSLSGCFDPSVNL